MHRTLERVEAATQKAREDFVTNREQFVKDFENAKAKIERQFQEELEKLKTRKDIDPNDMMIQAQMVQDRNQRLLQTKTDQLQKDRDLKTRDIERKLTLSVRAVQNGYKLWALLLPPIPPLLIGLAVLVNRRAGEREGVARSRLR
jgi:ABC-2 type transport system permease protein